MPIETICQGCSKRLRVGDEHAGKTARCPQCQTIYTVPQPAAAAALGAGVASHSPLPTSDRWHLKTPGGLTFGPVARVELDRWLVEGRITPTSQILHEGDGQWVWAGQVYPQLVSFAGPAAFPVAQSAPISAATVAGVAANPYVAGSFPAYTYREAHRGPAILALGLVSILACQLIAIAPILMGFADLDKMKRGVMDPAGRGLTIAGLVLGCLAIVLFVLQILLVIIMIAADV
ncbi:MAG: hypothetical protein SFU86_22920 [Pirellulaceae bacterium]|nr:hypothetical protein [Pirellulaceae bacterium]